MLRWIRDRIKLLELGYYKFCKCYFCSQTIKVIGVITTYIYCFSFASLSVLGGTYLIRLFSFINA